MTAAFSRGTVLLIAVNRFIAMAIEHALGIEAVVHRAGWSDEELDVLCERKNISAVVVDVTFLNEDMAVPRLVDLFDCPVIAVKASDPGLRIVEPESTRFLLPVEPLNGWFASVALGS